jgi:hypothetical protein
MDFKSDKFPWYYFLHRGIKAVCPMLYDFYGMLKNPAEYDRDTSWSKFKDVSRQLYASLLDVSAATREFWWMNQELLKLRWGHSIDQKMAAVHGALCRIPARNSKQQDFSKCFTTYTSVNPPYATHDICSLVVHALSQSI